MNPNAIHCVIALRKMFKKFQTFSLIFLSSIMGMACSTFYLCSKPGLAGCSLEGCFFLLLLYFFPYLIVFAGMIAFIGMEYLPKFFLQKKVILAVFLYFFLWSYLARRYDWSADIFVVFDFSGMLLMSLLIYSVFYSIFAGKLGACKSL